MERETFDVTTPVEKRTITIKSWLTGGEKMEMMRTDEKQVFVWMLKTIVVSPSFEELEKLHGKDFDFLLKELGKVAENSSWSEEKKA